MNTRVKLWKDYREEINNNSNLQEAVLTTNKNLQTLYQKLVKVYPEYATKYQIPTKNIESISSELPSYAFYDDKVLKNMIIDLQEFKFKESDFSFINDFDFSSHELDNIVKAIKSKKIHKKRHIIFEPYNSEIHLLSPQKIKFKGKKKIMLKNNSKFNIAIDGPSGSGKSTVAKIIAEKYDLNYINTGLVYRAMALHCQEQNINFNDQRAILKALPTMKLKLLPNEQVILNHQDVSKKLREDQISQKASQISIIQKVRDMALIIQQNYAKQKGTIMDGRDTTFRIMPEADIKIFLDTNSKERARRRVKQNQELGFETDYETILKEIEIRDQRDKNRKIDPLHKVDDAVLIDASKMSIEQVVSEIEKLIYQKTN